MLSMTCIVSLRLLTGGGRVAVSRTLVTQHGAPPEVGSATGVAEQIAALRAPAENKAAVAWLDETLAQFNSNYVAVSGFEQYTADKLAGILELALKRFFQGNAELRQGIGDTRVVRSLANALEAYILAACHEKLLVALRVTHKGEDEQIAQVCRAMGKIVKTVEQLVGSPANGATDSSETSGPAPETVAAAAKCLHQMQAATTPAAKVQLALATWWPLPHTPCLYLAR